MLGLKFVNLVHAPCRVALAVVALAAVVVVAVVMLPGAPGARAQAGQDLPHRLVLPLVARGEARPPLPPVDPGYCPGTDAGGGMPATPPNSVLGLLRIGGVDVPAGSVVQVLFDGRAGPAALTAAAGGYRVDYQVGAASCINHTGAALAIRVNGVTYDTGRHVGDPAADPFLRFDIVQ